MRLLIVDAVDHSRTCLAAFLNLQECLEVVGEAAGADEAIRLAQQRQPQVVIMDVHLPDVDGFTATRRLLELEAPPAVILLTIHRRVQDLLQAREAGAVACVEKSAGVDEILDTLHGLSAVQIEAKASSAYVTKEMIMNSIAGKPKEIAVSSTESKATHTLLTFFILTYALTFLTWGVLAALQMRVANTADTSASTSALAMTLYMLGGFTPSIAGFIMTYRMRGGAGVRDMWQRFTQFKLGARWYLVIIAIPLLVQSGTALIYVLQGGDFSRPGFLEQPVSLIPTIIAVFIGGPFSEEFGWRGFAMDQVQARWGDLKGSLILGLVWAFWHLPLFFVPGSGQQQAGNPALIFPLYAIQVVAMSSLYTWIYNNTNRSLWGAIFFHFTINFSAVMLLGIAEGASRFMYVTNPGFMVLLAVVVYIYAQRRQQLGA